jgi:hypothetical protein
VKETEMNTRYNALPESPNRTVYIRAVQVADLPDDLREQAEGIETLYAVHRPNGERLALVANRGMAFALAREHDLAPVNVH